MFKNVNVSVSENENFGNFGKNQLGDSIFCNNSTIGAVC